MLQCLHNQILRVGYPWRRRKCTLQCGMSSTCDYLSTCTHPTETSTLFSNSQDTKKITTQARQLNRSHGGASLALGSANLAHAHMLGQTPPNAAAAMATETSSLFSNSPDTKKTTAQARQLNRSRAGASLALDSANLARAHMLGQTPLLQWQQRRPRLQRLPICESQLGYVDRAEIFQALQQSICH